MLSMVNANRFINTVVIPVVIVAYGIFLWVDHDANDFGAAEIHWQNIKNIGRVDGLLFGGSNAVYGLSAESLNYFTGLKWYNLSVTNELGSTERHKNFIKDFSARIDRTKVRYIVYSSLLPYETGMIDAFKSDNSEKYINDLEIKPKISVFQYIRHGGWREKIPQRRNIYGDLVFDERVNCDFSEKNHAARKPEVVREDIDIAADFLVEMTTFFRSVFPNALIQIVLPSEYYGGLSFDDSLFEQSLRTKFYELLPEKYWTSNTVKIIFQPPFPSITQVCDKQVHANEDGRLWRTQNLVESMREIVPRNRAMTQ